MSAESEIRSRYLALALDARRVIDVLMVFMEAENPERGEEFDKSLQGAIESLQMIREKKDVFSPLRNRSAFSEYYEQVRTVEDALPPPQMEQVVEKLRSVKLTDVPAETQKQDAYEAIKLLAAIESRALYYYRPQS